MLELTIGPTDLYDENTNEFICINKTVLRLEHSLVSLSKWESKWKKPFLRKEPMSYDEFIDYVRCMTVSQNVDPIVYSMLNSTHVEAIKDYIDDPMTATWFSDKAGKPNHEIITAERIYYWMIAHQIPVEFQKWHLNRLLTLIKVCNEENAPKKKKTTKEIQAQYRALNAARRQQLGTKG